MARHAVIAALFFETALLAGCGVVIAQLWVRAERAEQRAVAAQEEAEQQRAQAEATQQRAQKNADHLQVQLASHTSDVQQQEVEIDQLRTEVLKLTTQNESLQEAAEQAQALSEKVADLEHRLQQAATGESAGPDEQLVEFQPAPTDQVSETRTADLPNVRFDDTGWRAAPRPTISAMPIQP